MDRYLSTAEAAERLGFAPQTLRIWRLRGVGPKYTKPSSQRVLYSEFSLQKFLDDRTFQSTSEETVRRESAAAGA